MKLTNASQYLYLYLYLLLILVVLVSSKKKNYIKESILKEDMNQSEAIRMAKDYLNCKKETLHVLAVYANKEQFKYSYLIYLARIVDDDNFSVHSLTIYCSKESYWSADVYNAIEEKKISLSFHMPLYLVFQEIVEKYYEEKHLHLKHLGFIHQCGELYLIRSVLGEQTNTNEILVIAQEEEGQGKYAIETMFTLK